MSRERSESKARLLDRFRNLFEETEEPERSPQRASKRVKLPVAVRLQIELGEIQDLHLRDLSLHGLCILGTNEARRGQKATVYFEGYPEVCEPFALPTHVVRTESEPVPAVAVAIDRDHIQPNVLEQYRRLVLHYLHHRPLLEEVAKGFSEVRCIECGWVGHVGERTLRCSRCGGQVRPVTKEPSGPSEGF